MSKKLIGGSSDPIEMSDMSIIQINFEIGRAEFALRQAQRSRDFWKNNEDKEKSSPTFKDYGYIRYLKMKRKESINDIKYYEHLILSLRSQLATRLPI